MEKKLTKAFVFISDYGFKTVDMLQRYMRNWKCGPLMKCRWHVSNFTLLSLFCSRLIVSVCPPWTHINRRTTNEKAGSTKTQQRHSQNDNLGHLHHIVVEAALFKCQQTPPRTPPPLPQPQPQPQPPTAPAKIRQIKHHYSRHSHSWPLKWFYVNYHNGLLWKPQSSP